MPTRKPHEPAPRWWAELLAPCHACGKSFTATHGVQVEKSGRCQVTCPICGEAGPVAIGAERAVRDWNEAQAFAENALEVIDEMTNDAQST